MEGKVKRVDFCVLFTFAAILRCLPEDFGWRWSDSGQRPGSGEYGCSTACLRWFSVFENLQIWSVYCFASSGGVEQSKPHKEAAGESQRSDSGPEEDPRVSPAYASAPGFIQTGQAGLKSFLSHPLLQMTLYFPRGWEINGNRHVSVSF